MGEDRYPLVALKVRLTKLATIIIIGSDQRRAEKHDTQEEEIRPHRTVSPNLSKNKQDGDTSRRDPAARERRPYNVQ